MTYSFHFLKVDEEDREYHEGSKLKYHAWLQEHIAVGANLPGVTAL